MAASALDSAVFRDIFGSAAMRQVFSDENRVQCYLDIEAALARVAGAARHHSAKRQREEICRHCRAEEFDMALLKRQTERIGYPVLPVVQQLVRAVPRRSRRVVPLGRHHAGHHRHRDGTANPRRARHRRDGARRDRRIARRSRPALSRHADGGAQQPAAGGADHLRLQDGGAARRDRPPSRTPQGAAPARAGRRVRRRRRKL